MRTKVLRIVAWTLAVAPAVAAAQAGAQAGDEIRFGNAKIELRFDKATGRWLSLRNPVDGAVLMDDTGLAPVLLTTGGRTTVTTGREHIWSIKDADTVGAAAKLTGSREERNGNKRRLVLQTTEGDWRIVHTYEMSGEDDTVERRVSVTWNGPAETLLRWVDFRTPASDARGENLLEAPGYTGILHQRLARLPLGQWPLVKDGIDREATLWSPGLLILRYQTVNALVWTFSASVPSFPTVWKGDRGVWLNEQLIAASRMKKGQTLSVGTQYIRLAPGRYMEALKRFQNFWNQVGIKLSGETPSWARGVRIYEVQVGPKGFRGEQATNPYPDVGRLEADLDRIAALGFNAILLMPQFPFPAYSVSDYMDVSTQYAPEAGLRRMIDRAHALGMKVLLDVVMHGVVDKTLRANAAYDVHPWLKEHPDWFVRTEDGRVSRTYTWALDQSSPGLQDYMVGVFRYYVGTLGADGFRIDAEAWNLFPNWAVGLDRPAHASIYGCVPLVRRLREEARKTKPDVVFYSESLGPLTRLSYDLGYNYDEHWLYEGLLPLVSNRSYYGAWPVAQFQGKTNARDMAEWLEMRRLVLPAGLIRVHHIDSHDSQMYAREAFGTDGAKLLFAWSSFIDGGVMSYVWGEKGSEVFYGRVLELKQSTAAIRNGSCDYLALKPSSDRVFAPLWRSSEGMAIPVFAFSDQAVEAEIPLEALQLNPDEEYTLREAFSSVTRTARGRELTRLSVNLPAYGVQLWTVDKASRL